MSAKTLSRVEVFENGGSASLCGRVKTEVFKNEGSASLCGRAKMEVFENDYVTSIGMSQLKKQKAKRMFSYTFSVVKCGRSKTLVWTKNFLSVFKKQKTEVYENALVWTGLCYKLVDSKLSNQISISRLYQVEQLSGSISALN